VILVGLIERFVDEIEIVAEADQMARPTYPSLRLGAKIVEFKQPEVA
jgi:hypothetical protein